MPTGKDIRAKNERNARNAQLGKTKPRAAYADRTKGKVPVSKVTLGLICFVVIGGGFSFNKSFFSNLVRYTGR